jgi:thioredoxin-related protein
VVFFWQDFCAYCKNTIEKNLTQQSIRDVFDQHFDVVALNIWGDKEVYGLDGEATTEKEIARALDVQFTPTIIFFSADGKPVLRLNGYVSPNEMQVALNYVKTKTYESQSIFEYLGLRTNRERSMPHSTPSHLSKMTRISVPKANQRRCYLSKRTVQIAIRFIGACFPLTLSENALNPSTRFNSICGPKRRSRRRRGP